MSMTNSMRTFSDSEFIDAVTELAPAGTPEVAEYVDCTRENARIRLLNLYEHGEINQKTIGGSYVWYME